MRFRRLLCSFPFVLGGLWGTPSYSATTEVPRPATCATGIAKYGFHTLDLGRLDRLMLLTAGPWPLGELRPLHLMEPGLGPNEVNTFLYPQIFDRLNAALVKHSDLAQAFVRFPGMAYDPTETAQTYTFEINLHTMSMYRDFKLQITTTMPALHRYPTGDPFVRWELASQVNRDIQGVFLFIEDLLNDPNCLSEADTVRVAGQIMMGLEKQIADEVRYPPQSIAELKAMHASLQTSAENHGREQTLATLYQLAFDLARIARARMMVTVK